ncbi:MAG TPA: phosphate ABC transporter substrate-binding/OmpA family protein [Polyangiaceae bacterium]|nr:phosphate ABC transporter substrate-binding/OmpA family protein [Polyangiaceae bacterium]
MQKLSSFSKFLIAAIVAGSSATAVRTYGVQWRNETRASAATGPAGVANSFSPGGAIPRGAPLGSRRVRIAVSQWPGHMALLVAAGGLTTQPGSVAARFGLDLEVVFIEDAPSKNKALQSGEVDFVWQTVDELPISLAGYRAARTDVRAFLQIDWSRGGDACVSSKEVQKVEDLVGRKSAMLLFSPDHTVFEFMIENSRLTPEQIAETRRAALFSPEDFTYARTLFVENKVDVACLWEPDVTLALAGRPGAHRLFSTADATELVADVLLAKKEVLDEFPEVAEKLAKVWFEAVEIADKDHPAAARLIASAAPRFRDELGYEKTLKAIEWAKWTRLTDNVRFFGLDGSTPAFDRVYNQADGIWVNYPQAEIKDRFVPSTLRDDRAVRRVWEAKGKPSPTKADVYERKTAQVGNAVFTKPVSINFNSGSNELDPEAIGVVNQQILPQIEIARGMSIRLEGNTDLQGDRWTNQRLSELRAQAILEYLVSRGVPRDRMVARGNGSANPVATNATPEGRAQNRRTDVLFIRNSVASP